MSTNTPTVPAERLRAPSTRPSQDEITGARLLIVDDEAAIVQALGKYLRARGYDVETAASGAEALERLKRSPQYKLMLCDVRNAAHDRH